MNRKLILAWIPVCLVALLIGCGGSHDHGSKQAPEGKEDSKSGPHSGHGHAHGQTEKANPEKESAHDHEAPHGGTLIVFGEEFAHMELKLDEQTGKLTCYILDGEAKAGVRLKTGTIRFEAHIGEKEVEVTLNGVANELSGETVNDTSQFEATVESLKGQTKFEAHIESISIKGFEFKDVSFSYPEGNETEAAHEGHGEHDD